MKLSKKLKTKVNKIALITLALCMVAIALVFVYPKSKKVLLSKINGEIQDTGLQNEIQVIRDSTGINLKITAQSSNSVRKVEVYQENDKIKEFNYADGLTIKQEEITIKIPFGESNRITVMVNGIPVIQKDIENLRYISNINDLVSFRNIVNNGNKFTGKQIDLIADIDLSQVCGAGKGSWTPIGCLKSDNTSVYFQGNFNGHFHKIKNLYINATSSVQFPYFGFFGYVNGCAIIENLIMQGGSVTLTGTGSNTEARAGAICGCLEPGTLRNCANLGVKISVTSTKATACAGGLAGIATGYDSSSRYSLVYGCFNTGAVYAKNGANRWGYNGGIIGQGNYYITVEDCYNTGAITAGYVSSSYLPHLGGIIGENYREKTTPIDQSIVRNSYNTGVTNASVANGHGCIVGGEYGGITNTYYLNSSPNKPCGFIADGSWNGAVGSATNCYSATAAQLKTYASKLGTKNWTNDIYGINGGYPILKWQVELATLNSRHEYMHIGETKQLKLDTSKLTFTNDRLSWGSFDNSIATVDSNGLLTAVGEGTTTVWAMYSQYNIKVMTIINVAKNGAVTIPAVVTGSDSTTQKMYTMILKEDGTVWGTGDNSYGQLGDGTTVSSLEPVQVKINQNEYLTDIVKIVAGYGHCIALTKTGDVYTWGNNSNGQLGNGGTANQYYAEKVSTLESIVDISAGGNYNAALDQTGKVYTWGQNANGQLGDGGTTNSSVPKINKAGDTIKVSCGWSNLSNLLTTGVVEACGANGEGRLGIGNTTSTGVPTKTNLTDVIDIHRNSGNGMAKLSNGDVYIVGPNYMGELGNGTTSNASSYVKTTLPSSVTTSNKVKAMGGSGNDSLILLNDGTIWTVGENTEGQFSIGTTATKSTSWVQAKKEDGTYITNARNIGRTLNSVSSTTGYAQTLNYIDNDGYIYSSGNNTYGNYGNGTTSKTNYYTKMGNPYLVYTGKEAVLSEGERYSIDFNKLLIVDQFNVNIDFTEISVSNNVEVTTEDTDIISLNGNRFTGIKEGYARVKLEDKDNNMTTYILVKVINDKYTDLEVGSKFTVALRNDGKVYTWGSNTYGEAGTGSTKQAVDKPEQVKDLSNIIDIAAGSYHALALNSSGEVYSWGLNNSGQLGQENSDNLKKPTKISGLSNITKVEAHKYYSLALDKDGNLYAWGEGYKTTPEKIAEDVRDITKTEYLSIDRHIKKLDGSLIHNVKNVVALSSYDDNILAVLANGKVKDIDYAEAQTELTLENAVQASIGNGTKFILDKNLEGYSYGNNTNGELGIGSNTAVTTPTKINVQNIEFIKAGEGDHISLATFDGSIYTTGMNDKGQLGHGDVDNKNVFEIVLNVAIESNVDKIVKQIGETERVEIGLGISLNLKKDLTQDSTSTVSIVDDTIASLVENYDGSYTVTGKTLGRTFLNATIVGNIQGEEKQFATNIEVRIVPEGGVTVPQVKSGNNFSVALKADGEMESWGNNIYGQLGIGNKETQDEPQNIEGIEETIVEIAAGDNHVLALTEDGTIYGWGLNNNGQVGNGTKADQVSQAIVINIYGNELSKIIRVEAHGDNSFAINEDGEVYAWGKDFGTKAVKLTSLENAVDISTSYYVRGDGTVWTNAEEPQKLSLVGKVRIMDEGVNHTVFLTNGGIAYSIGDNTFGQLGNGNNDPATSDVVAIRKNQTDLFENITQIEAGDRETVLLDKAGNVYTTGLNKVSKEETNIPTKKDDLSNVFGVSIGNTHKVAIKKDGTAWSFGTGTTGELGNRERKDSSDVVMVGPYIIRISENNIVLGKNDSKEITAQVNYFNILKEEKINITATSKDTQVARVSKTADVEGMQNFKIDAIKEGTASIVLTEEKAGTIGIINVEVLPESGTRISPDVQTVANHTVMLKTNGTVWSYGTSEYENLDDEPSQVLFGEGVIIKQIAIGEYHNVALDLDGNVYTWGRNNYYQLGVTGIESSETPIKVEGIEKVTKIAAGNNSVMCVTEDNKLVAWGQNAYGELGIGSYSNKTVPSIIEGVHDVLSLEGGKNHYILVKTNGEIFTVGTNLYGQIGIDLGDRTRTSTFEKVKLDVKFKEVSAGWTSNIAITVDGNIYTWGQNTNGQLGNGTKNNIKLPTQITGVNGIVEAEVGKTHTILRDYNKNIYLVGANNYGQLGNGTTMQTLNYDISNNIDDVLRVTAGNTYTVVMKKDGTVWGWGDYNHGSKLLKSRTNSKVPIQIGSDTSSLDKLEMVIKKSEVQSISPNSEYSFNLIYEEENNTSNFSYQSLDTEIAQVNETGDVLGVKEGTTWVKVTDNETGKVNVAIIRVVDNPEGYSVYTAPKIVTGENYAVALKEDGSIDVWGYDSTKIVDSNVPYSINVLASYVDVKSGTNHIVTLREDGTVWQTTASSKGKLVQVQNLSDIKQIAGGNDFNVATDKYGLTYVWGGSFGSTPKVLDTEIRDITYLSAGGKDQIVMVLPTGEVVGFGTILNGKIANLDNAVKVEVADDYILVLDNKGKVYKYQNGTLTKQSDSDIVDIMVSGNTYVAQKSTDDVFTYGIGPNNNYYIDNNGHVYAKGANNYGQIGNGTNINSEEYTLVGSRNFEIEPISSIMEVNDEEELTITGNTYNVFRKEANKDITQYDITSNDTGIVEYSLGFLKAKAEGLTTIDVKDKITEETITLTRKVVPMDQNRITTILENGNKAEATMPSDEEKYIFGYELNVPLDDDETEVALVITAKNTEDKISLDEGVTYSDNSTLNTTVTIPVTDDTLVLPIRLKATNGTEFDYELTINRVSNNNNISSIKVNSFEADKSLVEEDVYEIVVTDLGTNEIKVTAQDEDALVSIRGLIAEAGSQTINSEIPTGYIEVPIKVTSESGKAREVTLRITTPEHLLELDKLTINGTYAERQEDGTYKSIIADNVSRSKIYAKAKYEENYVQIDEYEQEIGTSEKTIITTDNTLETIVHVERTLKVDGQEQKIEKDYTLKIYKNKVFSKVEKVEVNGEEIEEENDTFIAYVLSSVDTANIKITAKDSNYTIKLDTEENKSILETSKELPNEENIFTFEVEDNEGNTKEYILKVLRGSTDTAIKKITVGKEDYVVEANKIEEELAGKPVYEARILNRYSNVDITVQTAYRNSKISINNNVTKTPRLAIENVDLEGKTILVPILIESEDGATQKEYVLKITRLEENTNISSIEVNELYGADYIPATLEDEEDKTRYEVHLNNPTQEVEIKAITEGEYASISINGEELKQKTTNLTVELESAMTEVEIKVISESGEVENYSLTIYTISDDVALESVLVGGKEATWNNITKRYEIKVDRDALKYNVMVTTTNENAGLNVAGTDGVGIVAKQVVNQTEETLVNIKVTAENEITTKTYQLAIIEKSNNGKLGYVKINGKGVSPDEHGEYTVEVVSAVKSVLIEVGAENDCANITLLSETKTGVWKNSRTLQSDDESYTGTIMAEDGKTTGDTFVINIRRLDGNTDIDKIEVTYDNKGTTKTVQPVSKEDGSYYLKIPRISENRVALRVNAKKTTTTVNVLGDEAKGSIYGYVNLTGEITTIPLVLTAEDGTVLETTLIIEKESQDTTLKEVKVGNIDAQRTSEGYSIVVDSNDEKINLTAIPTNEYAKVKLSTETEYTSTLDNKEVNIVGKNEIYVDVKAEDGETINQYKIQIIRTYSSVATSITINEETANTDGTLNLITESTANLKVTAKNTDAEIYVIKDNVTIASGVGTLTVPETIGEEDVVEYIVRIKGPNEYAIYQTEYQVNIRKKATSSNAVVYVDDVEINLNEETGKYEVSVSGESHVIKVTPESKFATSNVNNTNTDNATIRLTPNAEGTYTAIVTAEDGSTTTYTIKVYRLNNVATIKEVKLDDTTIASLPDRSYYLKIPRTKTSINVKMWTTDEKAIADINGTQEVNTVEKEVQIDMDSEITNVPLKVIAQDGTTRIYNLKLERESNDATLKEVKYDGATLTETNGTYEIEVDNRETSIKITAIPTNANAKVRVVGKENYLSTLNEENVDIEGKDSFEIEVKAEDGETTKIYTVNIKRVFSTKVTNVKVDGNSITPTDKTYSEYVSANAENYTTIITPVNDDAVVTIYDEENNVLITGIGETTLVEAFETDTRRYKVVVSGPEGYEEYSTEYIVNLTKKSTDTTAKIYWNDTELQKDEETGKYLVTTAVSNNNIKAVANNEFAKVSIDEKTYIPREASQMYSVNVKETKEVKVTILSQNGETQDYIIQIVRPDNDVTITKVEVNNKQSTKITNEFYRSAIETGLTETSVKITANSELATISAQIDGETKAGKGTLELTKVLPGVGTTPVKFKVTAEDGTEKEYTLNIVQNPTDNMGITVRVNNLVPEELDDSSYRIFVNNTSASSSIHIWAEDEFTDITCEGVTRNDVTVTKTLETEGDITIVNFNVTSEKGTTKDYVIYIIKESNDNSIESVHVNGVEITANEEGRYVAYVDNTSGNPTVKARAVNEYAYIRLSDYDEEKHETERVIKLEETRTTTIPIVTRSQSGKVETKYLDLIVTFSVAGIDSIIADDNEVTDYDETTKTYVALVENDIYEHEIQVIADNNYATLELNETVGVGTITTIVTFDEGEEIKEYTLYVTSETDLTTTYKVIVAQKSNNTKLSEVKVNDVTVPLDEDTKQYRKNIDMLSEKAKVEVKSEYPYATMRVGDEQIKTKHSGIVWVDLPIEQNEITIPVVVTAADGITIETYNIVLTRLPSTISGKVETQNHEGIHVANIYVYKTSDKRKIDDKENPREVMYHTVSNNDGSYKLELPYADTYDIVYTKLGYLTHTITKVVAESYANVDVQDVTLKAGDVVETGEIEVDDLVAINDNYGITITVDNKEEKGKYDLNEDGKIDKVDRSMLKANYHEKAVTEEWDNPNKMQAALAAETTRTRNKTKTKEGEDDTEETEEEQTSAETGTRAQTLQGQLILPVKVAYEITSEYGERVHPVTKVTKRHTGIDLGVAHHSEVIAIAEGEVTFSGVQKGFGNCVEIRHEINGETIYSFYAHLSKIDVKKGDIVIQGETIGLEGGDPKTDPNPGSSTGHHLHFEIRTASGYGNDVDPNNYFEF